MMAGTNETPLQAATQGIRDAAKYLIAVFGAIGAVLVGGLSFTALPAGSHPLIAVLAVAGAVLALAFLIGLVVSVLTPEAVTLGQLSDLEHRRPNSYVVVRLQSDEALFVGQGTDLGAFHQAYVQALGERAARQEDYLQHPGDAARQGASEVASARAELLDEAVSHVLEAANFFRVQERFSWRRRALMMALALLAVGAVGVFSWASAKPSASPKPRAHPYSRERIWLEHLIATSTYRIEMLDRAKEHSSPAVRSRIDLALTLQRRVQRRERDTLLALAPKTATSETVR